MKAKLFVDKRGRHNKKLKLELSKDQISLFDLKLYVNDKEICLRNGGWYVIPDNNIRSIIVNYTKPMYEAIFHDLDDLNIKQVVDGDKTHYLISPNSNVTWNRIESIDVTDRVVYETVEYVSDDHLYYNVVKEKYIVDDHNPVKFYDLEKWSDVFHSDFVRKCVYEFTDMHTENTRGLMISFDTIEEVNDYKEHLGNVIDLYINKKYNEFVNTKIRKVNYV